MALFPKEIADKLYQEGRIPEWWYRQKYYTFDENYAFYSQKDGETNRKIMENRIKKQQEKEERKRFEKELEKKIDDTVISALDKAIKTAFEQRK